MALIDRATVLGSDKSLPPWAAGLTVDEFLSRRPTVDQCWTPLLLIDRARLSHNIGFLSQWVNERALELMPHGKTSMSPGLWREQIDAGASGITVATPWQARIAVEAGFSTVMLAHQAADAGTARWVADQQSGWTEVITWVDSPSGIALMADAGVAAGTEVPVLVELGRPGGRTGTRTVEQARALVALVRESPGVRLAGVAGYEGAITRGRSAEALNTVRDYVADLVSLAVEARDAGAAGNSDGRGLIVTAGGSAYPDAVADALAPAVAKGLRGVLRCGAYVLHDEGHYLEMSPFDHTRHESGLLPAARAHARVTSVPEPGLALLDAGKRDVPYDEGLPTPVAILRTGGQRDGLANAHIDALNDQHTFLRAPDAALAVGDRIELALSHPCTMTDKWRLIPVVDDLARGADAVIVDLLPTSL
ncbi:alanine racemase [Demequina flava]|uniref:alanine racemase n=1 Tax=Demequina flava TaxID=1095025 RepID=UPI000780F0C0|nr:alanine racemase [Demequina flava]